MQNRDLQAAEPPLELCNVTKFYGEFKAVDDVGFTLPAGSVWVKG